MNYEFGVILSYAMTNTYIPNNSISREYQLHAEQSKAYEHIECYVRVAHAKADLKCISL